MQTMTMTTAIDPYQLAHDQLLVAISRAREASEAAFLAYKDADLDSSAAAYDDWRMANTRHMALTEAGLIISLGFAEGE